MVRQYVTRPLKSTYRVIGRRGPICDQQLRIKYLLNFDIILNIPTIENVSIESDLHSRRERVKNYIQSKDLTAKNIINFIEFNRQLGFQHSNNTLCDELVCINW